MSDPHGSPPRLRDDEPASPLWLPALGAALFIALAVWWATLPSAARPPATAGAGGAPSGAQPAGAAPPAHP
jgi:hypothetical protein